MKPTRFRWMFQQLSHQNDLILFEPLHGVCFVLACMLQVETTTLLHTFVLMTSGGVQKSTDIDHIFSPPDPLPSQRKRVRYSELDFEKVMHTRKRHSELYPELNHSTTKFHTIDRYNRDPAMSTFKVLPPPPPRQTEPSLAGRMSLVYKESQRKHAKQHTNSRAL
eukprot:XP_013998464.1 PREDICTED: uncharacterized protein LOC106570547 isoform X2 [Salmo salar]